MKDWIPLTYFWRLKLKAESWKVFWFNNIVYWNLWICVCVSWNPWALGWKGFDDEAIRSTPGRPSPILRDAKPELVRALLEYSSRSLCLLTLVSNQIGEQTEPRHYARPSRYTYTAYTDHVTSSGAHWPVQDTIPSGLQAYPHKSTWTRWALYKSTARPSLRKHASARARVGICAGCFIGELNAKREAALGCLAMNSHSYAPVVLRTIIVSVSHRSWCFVIRN